MAPPGRGYGETIADERVTVLLLKNELRNAALEIREADAALAAIVAELESAGVFTGDDARRCEREWTDRVQNPLRAAAGIIDAVDFVTL